MIEQFENKLKLMANDGKKTVEKVLISSAGASDSLIGRAYFDRVITLADIFEAVLK